VGLVVATGFNFGLGVVWVDAASHFLDGVQAVVMVKVGEMSGKVLAFAVGGSG